MKRTKPPSQVEQGVLDIVLKELRRAVKIRGQLTVIIDPWLAGDGVTVFASPSTAGRSYQVAKDATRAPGKKKRRA